MQSEPELIIDKSGNKYWCLNGKIHREDGPAIEYSNGIKEWYLSNKLHRIDGPAVVYPNGEKRWCLENKLYSFEKWLKLTPLSEQEKVKLRLKYGQ